MFSTIMALHLLAIGAILWHVIAGFWPSTTTIVTGVTLYIFTGFGIALGYHRLFTHEGYECGPVLKAILLIAGGLSLEGRITVWVKTHVQHHARSDKPGDGHSPFQYGGTPWLTLKGVLWAHMGWLFYEYTVPVREGGDRIDRDRAMQFQSRHYHWIAIATFAIPALAGGVSGLISGGWTEMLFQALDGALVAGVLRVLLLLHVTWSINSVCHLIGKQMAIETIRRNRQGKVVERKHYPSDGSRNAWWWLRLLSFGEANHALHHLFERIAYHAWGKWGLDPAKWALILLEKCGLVWNVQKPPEFTVLPTTVELPEASLITAAREARMTRKALQLAA
jgi:stearoyl-CoA desaturase (delta-9 desaturase)